MQHVQVLQAITQDSSMPWGDPEDELLLSFTWDDVAPRIFKLFKSPTQFSILVLSFCVGIGLWGGWLHNALLCTQGTGRSRDRNMP